MLADTEMDLGSPVPYDPDEKDIRGKAIVVIGDNNGFAQAATELLTGYGAPVFIAAKNTAELKATLAAIAQTGGEVDGMVVDMNRPEDVRRFFEQAESWLGRIDAVISRAPGSGVEAEIRLNLVTQEALQRMRPGGQILNIGPTNEKNSPRSLVTRNMANALRRQAVSLGVRIAHIEPGSTDWNFDPQKTALYVLKSLIQPSSMERATRPLQIQPVQ